MVTLIKVKILFSDSEEENQNSDTTNSDEDSDGLEIRLDFQPIPNALPESIAFQNQPFKGHSRSHSKGSSFWHMKI